MHPELFFVMVGGVIVAGFLGNLLFKFAKIPSVLLLMGIGVLLGPVFNIVQSDLLFDFAPYFGTVALIIILFEGGLDLEIDTVVQQFGKAILLTFVVFLLTFIAVAGVGYFFMELPLLQSLMLGGIVGGTSPAIIIPVVSKLNVGNNVKTLLSLEPALADVLIILSVVICIGIFQTQSADPLGIFFDIFQSFAVAIIIAVIMGVVWARFIGSLGGESLSYMLTLGFLFLLYFLVEHFKGSGAIGVLFFGVVLANVGSIASRFGGPLHKLIGVKVDATKFVLDEFVHNITIELSFLVRTFFFVFLGLLFSFKALTPLVSLHIVGIVGACLLARYIGVEVFFRLSRNNFSSGEKTVIHGMAPRGLATAAMAFVPLNAVVPQTDLFPLYALAVIGLTSVSMTAFVGVAARKTAPKKKEKERGEEMPQEGVLQEPSPQQSTSEIEEPKVTEHLHTRELLAQIPWASSAGQERDAEARERAEDLRDTDAELAGIDVAPHSRTHQDESKEEDIRTFTERLVHWLHISDFRFKELDHFSVRSTVIVDLLYWLQMLGATAVAVLGLVMDNQVIVFAGMMFAPVAASINTASLALTTGDIYLFLKSVLKFLLTGVVIVGMSAFVASLVPFAGLPSAVVHLMQPTVLDFVLSFIMGILLPIAILRGRALEIFAVAPIVAFLIVPALAIVGYGIGSDSTSTVQIISGGLLSFSANITALLISSVLTLLTLGVTEHRAAAFVAEWKQRELSNGVMSTFLSQRGFARLLSTAGTIHARLIVLAIFALVLFIPLSTSINEVSQRYNVRQAVNQYSKLFEQANRSSVLSVDVEFRNKQINTHIRVATNTLFTDADIERFENIIEKQTGFPTDLTLVQSYGDIGAAKSLSVVGNSSRDVAESFHKRLASIAAETQRAVAAIPVLSEIDILGAGLQFPSNRSPFVVVEYLAPEQMSYNMALLLRNHVAEALGVPDSTILTSWIPREFAGYTPTLALLTNAGSGLSAADVLQRYPQLTGMIAIPKKQLKNDSLASVRELMRQQNNTLADTVRFSYTVHDSPLYSIRFRK